MATFSPAPRPMSEAEVAALECELRSGIAPDLALARRLVATIRDRETALRWQSAQVRAFVAAGSNAAQEVF